jgi:hypothetical protein
LLLPEMTDAGGTARHLAVGAGKGDIETGKTMLYVVDRDSMGKFHAGADTVYQELSTALEGGTGVFAAPAYFNGTLYYGAVDDNLKGLPISQAKVASSASSESQETYGYPGTTPSISANGSASGIVWAVDNGGGANSLRAYDATDLNTEFFTVAFPGSNTTKFVTPLIANGKVYVGTGSPNASTPGSVVVFGLTNPGTRLWKGPRATRDRRRWLREPTAPRTGASTPGS